MWIYVCPRRRTYLFYFLTVTRCGCVCCFSYLLAQLLRFQRPGAMSDTCHGRLVRPGRAPVAVSLSVLHELTSDGERRNFLTTAVKMATFTSDNVQRLEGVVASRTPQMIVTPLSSNGSLLDFIRVRFTISTSSLVVFASSGVFRIL